MSKPADLRFIADKLDALGMRNFASAVRAAAVELDFLREQAGRKRPRIATISESGNADSERRRISSLEQ